MLHGPEGEKREDAQPPLTPPLTPEGALIADIAKTRRARVVQPEGVMFVHEYLNREGEGGYVKAVSELESALESRGYKVRQYYFQALTAEGTVDKEQWPFAALVARRVPPDGSVLFGIPNINAVLNPVVPGNGGQGGAPGKKYTMTSGDLKDTDGIALSIEEFEAPVALMLYVGQGTFKAWDEVGAAALPLEAIAAFSPDAVTEAYRHARDALATQRPHRPHRYSYLLDEKIEPQVALKLHDMSKTQFGLRETPVFTDFKIDPKNERALLRSVCPYSNRPARPVWFLARGSHDGPFLTVSVNSSTDGESFSGTEAPRAA